MNNFAVISEENYSYLKDFIQNLNADFIKIDLERFADGEIEPKINLQRIKNKKIIFFKKFYFHSSINEQIFETLMIISFLEKQKPAKIILATPYLAYSRHDKSKIDPEAIGIFEDFLYLLKQSGVNQIFACDLHCPSLIEKLPIKISNLCLVDFWQNFISQNIDLNNENIVIIAPDHGCKLKAQKISNLLKLNPIFMEKKRIGPDETIVLNFQGNVENKVAILVDDILGTGTTAINAALVLKKNGASKIIGCFSHGIFSSKSNEKLLHNLFEKIFITDSILQNEEKKIDNVDILPLDKLFIDFITNNLVEMK